MSWGDVATWIGIAVAAGVGGWGIRQAAQANRLAGRSAEAAARSTQIAEDALAVSKRADERADRLERIATDRNDIEWKLEWIEDSDTISVRNIGTDTAYDVELTIDTTQPTGFPRQVETQLSVGGGNAIGYRYPSSTTQQARDSFTRGRQEMNASGLFIAGGSAIHADVRLTWRSEARTPGNYACSDVSCP